MPHVVDNQSQSEPDTLSTSVSEIRPNFYDRRRPSQLSIQNVTRSDLEQQRIPHLYSNRLELSWEHSESDNYSCSCGCCPECIGIYDLVINVLSVIIHLEGFITSISHFNAYIKSSIRLVYLITSIIGIVASWRLIKSTSKDLPRDVRRKLAREWQHFNLLSLVMAGIALLVFLFVAMDEAATRSRYSRWQGTMGYDHSLSSSSHFSTFTWNLASSIETSFEALITFLIIFMLLFTLFPLITRSIFHCIISSYIRNI